MRSPSLPYAHRSPWRVRGLADRIRGSVFSIALAAAAAALAPCARATAAELVSTDGPAPFRLGWQRCEVTGKPAARLRKQPAYGSRTPCYFALRLGNDSRAAVIAALDESRGKGAGYDRLYLDANNNLDLTDDTPVAISSNTAERTLAFDTDPIPVTIRYDHGGQRQMKVRLEIRGAAADESHGGVAWTVMCCVDQHLEARVDIGARTNLLVGIYDASRRGTPANGCFNDYQTDRFRVDLDGDGRLDERTEDYPLSRAISLDGKLWDFSVEASGGKVNVSPSLLRTGRARLTYTGNPAATGEAELAGGNGMAFVCVVSGQREADLPEGAYAIASARMTVPDSTGGLWKAAFNLDKTFAVKHGRVADVALGAPLRVTPSIHSGKLAPGNDLCIAADIAGAGGETYEDISRAGARMSPAVKIVDANDVVVASGNMEYG